MSSQPAQEHKPFLHDMNKGKFKGMDLFTLTKSLNDPKRGGSQPSLSRLMPKAKEDQDKLGKAKIENEREVMKEALKENADAINNEVEKLRKVMENKPDYIPITGKGYIKKVETENQNLTRIVKDDN